MLKRGRNRLGLACFLFIFAIATLGRAQQWTSVEVVPDKEKEFQKALYQYQLGNYKAAFIGFEALASAAVLHQRMTAAWLMTGKSLYHLERYRDAVGYFSRLIDTFPQSQYVDDAHYARAQAYYRLGNHVKAARDLLWLLDFGSDSRLKGKARRLVTHIMREKVPSAELYDLLKAANGARSAGLVAIEIAQMELAEGRNQRARQVLNAYRQAYPSGPYDSAVDRLLREAESDRPRPTRVGVILPLTGYFSEEGRGVFKGIKFAQTHGPYAKQVPVQLDVWDSESNVIKAIEGVKKLAKRDRVRVIIGELESDITAGIGALASEAGVPLLAPAATENGVAGVGDLVFQMNSSLSTKGSALAEYAFNVLGLRTFATLAPADEYGQQMVDSFAARIDELGGRIIAQQWYYSGTDDLNLFRQFSKIREAAFAYDSTDVQKLIEEAEEKGEDLEEKDIAVYSIDGIFFPIYSEEIQYVAPQFALSNIRAQVLGGEYWDTVEILRAKQVQPYINGCIFVSDYFPDETSRTFQNFRNQFRLTMKTTPERWEVFGYDAMTLIQQVLKDGARTGKEIAAKLSRLEDFQGMKGKISFKGNRRVNREVNFLQFLNGRIIRHQALSN